MNFIIVLAIMILYGVLIGMTFGNMKSFDYKTKAIFLIIGVIVNFIITMIIVNIGLNKIENAEVYKAIKYVDIFIFTAVNSIVLIPTIGKYLTNKKMEIIDERIFIRKIIATLILYVVILIFEVNYLKGLRI